jgi:hypothetical protein
MKNIKYLLLFLVALGCSSDSETNMAPGDGTGGSLAIFALKGNYLYTVDHMNLNVFSLVNTAQPSKVNDVEIGFDIETLFANDDYLFVGSRNGMYIYSLENPENPVQLSQVSHFTACDPVVANATHAFVTLHSNSECGNDINVLEVYETSNPQYPTLVHRRNLSHPKGLGLYNNYLVVCDQNDLKFFDISNPAEPVLANALPAICYDVIITGDTMFAIGEHSLYRYLLNPNDIENPVLQSQVNF